ncbi:MAG: hypothetical protein FWC39_13875 [Bacteroidetes bacterium]|nr:hypothetical protein [Bacteroidota bacterium]
MNRQILKYLAVAAIAVMMLTGCEEVRIIEPCERDGTGVLKLINKTALRFTVKIDGQNYGQIDARDVKEYVLRRGETYVCIELSNAICYKDFTIDIIPCEITTKELNN